MPDEGGPPSFWTPVDVGEPYRPSALEEAIKKSEALWAERYAFQRVLSGAWLHHVNAWDDDRCFGEPPITLCPAEDSTTCQVRSCLRLGACRRLCWMGGKPWVDEE
jgi:hypothetical protein